MSRFRSKSGPGSGRRPSASLIVATIALFVALSGGAYAAVSLPSNSVGTAQLRHRAVTHDKLGVGAVGKGNIAVHQVQERIGGKCSGWSSISTVGYRGNVSCKRDLPAEIDTPGLDASVPVNGSNTVADVSLPAGSAYLVNANPYIRVTGSTNAPQLVAVTCALQAGAAKQSETATVDLTPEIGVGTATLPLTVTVPQGTSATPSVVACTAASAGGSGTPKVQVSSQINAIQTLKNESSTSAATSPTSVTVTTPSTITTSTVGTATTTTSTTSTSTTTTGTATTP